MIKNFETYINEDYFSKLANRKDNNIVRRDDEITEDFVRSYMNYDFNRSVKSIIIKKENGKTVVDIVGDFVLREDVEELPFQFGKITGNFYCSWCSKLKSLKGFPKEISGYFNLSHCENLTSLEGAPEKIGDYFSFDHCKKITTLEGCPKEVGGDFSCIHCGKRFTEKQIETVCNVEKEIYTHV